MDSYHLKYINQSNKEIEKRINEKKEELLTIFQQIHLDSNIITVKLAVLGCGDVRFVDGHKKIFDEVLNKEIKLTTFDITIEHLQTENNVVKHDCTLPLPNSPYTITYAHVLLKFIEIEKQWDVIINSYEALENGGIAIHIMDKEDYETKDLHLPDGYFSVPLKKWTEKITKIGIKFKEIPIKYGIALVLLK